jgi:hypothetical protein
MYGQLVNTYDFLAENIKVLTDEQATQANILDSLAWLVASNPDDVLVFHYSGHGTQIPDRNRDETDRKDEAICPHDVRDVATVITDDTVGSILKNIHPDARLYYISDSCHSASQDKTINLGTILRDEIPKFVYLPGVDYSNRDGIIPNIAPKKQSYALLSGCQDQQTSADAFFGDVPHGALTYGILRYLKADKNLMTMHNQVSSWLSNCGFSQRPGLSGPNELLNRPIFT